MRKTLLLFLVLPLLSYGQYGVPKKFSQIPISTVPAVSASDYFVGTHNNGDGTFTDYLYQPSSSIVDTVTSTILGVTYAALDSGLLTKLNAPEVVTASHTYSITGTNSNQFVRIHDTTGNNVVYLPNRPPDMTLDVVKTAEAMGSYYTIVQALGGAVFNKAGGGQTDTLKMVDQVAGYYYSAYDSTWSIMWNTPVNGLDKRYAPISVSGSVTSITAGTGLNGGTITTIGTISLPNVGIAGSNGSSSLIPVFTTDAQGRVTSEVNATPLFPYTDISGISGSATISYSGGVISIPSSVNLPGSPTATTQSPGNNSTDIATTAYVDGSFAALSGATFTGAVIIPKFSSNNQTGTSYTLALTDAGKYLTSTNVSAVTFTVPPNSGVAFPIDTYIEFENDGVGILTFAAGSGVTINISSNAGLNLIQYASCYLHKTGTNTWTLTGGNTP